MILKPAYNGRLFSIGIYFNRLGFGKEIGKESSWISTKNHKLDIGNLSSVHINNRHN